MKEPNYFLFTLYIGTIVVFYFGLWFSRISKVSGDKRYIALYQFINYTSIFTVGSLGAVATNFVDDNTPAAELLAQFTGAEAYGAFNDFVAACLIGLYIIGSILIGNVIGKRIFVYSFQHKIGFVRAKQICRRENC